MTEGRASEKGEQGRAEKRWERITDRQQVVKREVE